jgi:hypothetical protein
MRPYEEAIPEATLAGRRLYSSSILQTMSKDQVPVSEALLAVSAEIDSAE